MCYKLLIPKHLIFFKTFTRRVNESSNHIMPHLCNFPFIFLPILGRLEFGGLGREVHLATQENGSFLPLLFFLPYQTGLKIIFLYSISPKSRVVFLFWDIINRPNSMITLKLMFSLQFLKVKTCVNFVQKECLFSSSLLLSSLSDECNFALFV